MQKLLFALCFLVSALSCKCLADHNRQCRNLPGEPGFPSMAEWDKLNSSIDGRLVAVVPSAEFCHELPAGNCSSLQWSSVLFRATIPGAMANTNWEQDYQSQPPSLCLQNGTVCGQGNVPVFAVNATEARHIQSGVNFAGLHNLKVAIKASGHDFLGRSTAKGSLLLWTRNFRNVSFSDNFIVNGTARGSAMTAGSGMPLNLLYEEAKRQGKYYVGGITATVALAGGYIQGAGHSAFSPVFGLAADNALEFQVVIANGSLVTANKVENPELFWALRGGGGGSWGVVISATVRTYPIFNATSHTVGIIASTNESTADLMTLHARHIFDWDDVRAGQYFSVFNSNLDPSVGGNFLALNTFFANKSGDEAKALMKPLLDDARSMNFSVQTEETSTGLSDDLLFVDDDQLGINDILGSRLIPAKTYEENPEAIGQGIKELIESGVQQIIGHMLAGGKVAENANIASAVTPKWRSAKTHVIAEFDWPDSFSPAEVEAAKQRMTRDWVPILIRMTGESDSGAYSNEADVREPDFQRTFFGTNYPRLLQVKKLYDPNDLFIVTAGVGSERWDAAGICRISEMKSG